LHLGIEGDAQKTPERDGEAGDEEGEMGRSKLGSAADSRNWRTWNAVFGKKRSSERRTDFRPGKKIRSAMICSSGSSGIAASVCVIR